VMMVTLIFSISKEKFNRGDRREIFLDKNPKNDSKETMLGWHF